MADLTPQQAEFYGNLEQTFLSTGWKLLVQGWTEERDALPLAAFFNAQSMDDLRAAKVRFGLLDELINLPATIGQQKLNLLEAEGE
jgi:hypothetical protein